MIFRKWWVVALVLSGWVSAQEPALPRWKLNERKEWEAKGWVAGGLLLSDDPLPPEASGEPVTELQVEKPTAEEIAAEPLSSEIPEKYLAQYFAEKPTPFLVDPQGLLSPKDYRDREEFLKYHSGDSSIDLYIYLLKGDQEIPGDVREEEVVERLYSYGRPAAVIYYYLGAPQRSVLYLSPSLTESVPAIEQRRALQSSVMQAFQKLQPEEQLEAFLVQASIRVYWMERLLQASKPQNSAEQPQLGEAPAKKQEKPSFFRTHEPTIRAWVSRWAVPVSVMLAALVAGIAVNFWMRRTWVYRFPEIEVEPRLGGSHGAGVGAVISFASASLPPASQRDQVPDYLRRA
ncbi:MAG: hypothetical protein QM627_11465 [Luteolibacter sp.]